MAVPLAASRSLSVIYLLYFMGFFALFLFLSSDLTSCLCPSVLSLCLGVHWFSVVM